MWVLCLLLSAAFLEPLFAGPWLKIPDVITKLSRGVDITKTSFHSFDLDQKNGNFEAVIDFTCDQDKTWKNPYDKQLYRIPDQIQLIKHLIDPAIQKPHVEIRTYKTPADLKNTMASDAGIQYQPGMFSSSLGYKTINISTTKNSKVVTETFTTIASTESIFVPVPLLKLSKHCEFLLNHLPQSFKDFQADYEKFISVFGTHFFIKGQFGRFSRVYFETNKNYQATQNAGDLDVQIQGPFFPKYEMDSFEAKQMFSENPRLFPLNYETNAKLLAPERQSEEEAMIFGGSLVPIYQLITDEIRKNSLKEAIQVHLDKAFLTELNSSLEKDLHTNAQSLRRKVEERTEKIFPNHKNVTQLKNEFYPEMNTVPSWWKDTKLCFRYWGTDIWYSDFQCGYNYFLNSPVCASLNEYTSTYLDDTDNRAGGCKMSWGLFNPNLGERWFERVQLCFKSYPYTVTPTADRRQCNNGRIGEMCAPLNYFTPYYVDQTDDRPGGCLMSWQLRVPSESPAWLLNTKLCFYWTYFGDYTGECGLFSGSRICAFANHWTAYYLDDTDMRSTGCTMKWSIQDGQS